MSIKSWCNLQLHRQIDIDSAQGTSARRRCEGRGWWAGTESGGRSLTNALLSRALSPAETLSGANAGPEQAHCKLALDGSALLWASVCSPCQTAPPGTPAHELQAFLWQVSSVLGGYGAPTYISWKQKGLFAIQNYLLRWWGMGFLLRWSCFSLCKGQSSPCLQCQGVTVSGTPPQRQLGVLPSVSQAHTPASGTWQTRGTLLLVLWVIWGFSATWHRAIGTRTAPTCQWCFMSLTFLPCLQLFTSSASSLRLTSKLFSC